MVYLIRCNEYIKIGVATNIKTRIMELQTGNPYCLELIATKKHDSPYVLEKEMHKSLYKYKKRGEWYELTDELTAHIINVYAFKKNTEKQYKCTINGKSINTINDLCIDDFCNIKSL